MIIIVPASGRIAYEHFKKTIEKPWTLEDLLRLGVQLPKNVAEKLKEVDRFHIWGSIPDVVGWEKAWPRLDEDSIVMFYRSGYIIAWGYVFAKIRSRELAEKLWGRDKQGRTWEYIYFIRDLEKVRIPWDKVKRELGYKEGFVPRGHTIVSEDRVKSIIEQYGSVREFIYKLSTIDYGEDEIDYGEHSGSREFNPNNLLLPTAGTILRKAMNEDDVFKAALLAYGLFLAKMADMIEHSMAKSDAERIAEEILGNALGKYSHIKAMLYNDMRRLGVITIGRGGDWYRDVEARLTPLGYIVVSCVKRLRNIVKDSGNDASSRYLLFIGSLPVALCLEGYCPGCLREEAGLCLKLTDMGENIPREAAGVVNNAIKNICDNLEWLWTCSLPRISPKLCRNYAR